MAGPGILIAGKTLSGDQTLFDAISQIAGTIVQGSPSAVEQMLQRKPAIRLVLLEISRTDFDADLLQRLRRNFPEVQIILINGSGDRDLFAQAFALGVKDAFPRPLNHALLVERVAALYKEA